MESNEQAIEISKKAGDEFARIGEEMEYWRTRCLLVEKTISIVPNEFLRIEDVEAYNKFISENKQP